MKNEEILNSILSETKPLQSNEYDVRIAQKPTISSLSNSYGDLGCYVSANNLKEARSIVEDAYPSQKFTVVDIKPI